MPPNSASRIRAHRKALGVSAVVAAAAAGLSRVTLHRIERGEPSVTMGAFINVLTALGLGLDLVAPQQAGAGRAPPSAEADLPAEIRLAEYPELRRIAWSIPGASSVTPREAPGLYERQWRHVDRDAMPAVRTCAAGAAGARFGPRAGVCLSVPITAALR